MVLLPVQTAVAAGWNLIDYRATQRQSAPAVAGVAQLELEQLDADEMWLIDHAVVACTSSSATSVRLYAGAVSDVALIDGSASGNFDVADWPNGLLLPSSSNLIARWSGASAGAVGTLTVQLRVMRR